MKKLLIRSGKLINPGGKENGQYDILIEGSKIKKIAKKIQAAGAKVIDAKGLWVLPGLIDMHVHLRDPGRPDKETIESGSRAAALGGFTSIACMANTHPPIDTPAVVEYVRSQAKKTAVVNVYPVAAVTRNLEGVELAEMGRMVKEGAVAFSDDGHPIMRSDIMRVALEYASQFGKVIISHAEDADLSKGTQMNESTLSTEIGLSGNPAVSEEIMINREILLAREYGRVHIAHVSTKAGADIIRRAKKQGIDVTAETAPHYFSLTEEAVKDYDTNAKVNPPLRGKKDQQAIIKALNDGTIDVIATDHAPHTVEEKNVEFNQAASGIIGLETALGLAITELILKRKMDPKKVFAKLTVNPARILGINKGVLKAGEDADLIVVDPKLEWTVDSSKFASKSRNTPFNGWKLKGKTIAAIVGGKQVVAKGKLL